MAAGEHFDLVFQLGGAHVFGGGVDQIAHQRHRRGFAKYGGQGLDLAGEQDAGGLAGVLAAIAVEAVLAEAPAQYGGRNLGLAGDAIGAGGQVLPQPREAPWAECADIGDACRHLPAVPVGDDGVGVCGALEFLSGGGGALRGGEGGGPCVIPRLVGEVDGDRRLTLVWQGEVAHRVGRCGRGGGGFAHGFDLSPWRRQSPASMVAKGASNCHLAFDLDTYSLKIQHCLIVYAMVHRSIRHSRHAIEAAI